MRRILGLVLVACLLVVATSAPVVAAGPRAEAVSGADEPALPDTGVATQSSNGEITYFSMDGRGYIYDQEALVANHSGAPYVWASEPLETQLTLHPRPSTNNKTVCGRILNADGEAVDGATLGCTSWNTSASPKGATLELSAWPAGASGTYYLEYEFSEAVPATDGENGSADDDGVEWVVRDEYRAEVYVISKQGDLDDDGLSNAREVELETDFTRADSDGDGLSDRAEVFEYGSDPLSADSTGDGLEDGTVAGLGLPPTVPYVVHVVVFGGLLAIVGVAVGGVKLWQVLGRSGDAAPAPVPQGGPSPPSEPSTAVAANGDEPRTKEDEIFEVIHEHGGQMRQADLVDETEWSKATVSRLLSTLEDEGRVEKIRVGRGNVVRLTGESAEHAAPAESATDGRGN
jgi:hypothetical protein